VFAELEKEALASFRSHGIGADKVVLKRTADLRYVGQFHEVECDISNGKLTQKAVDAAAAAFARKHEELYTFAMPWKPVEVLTLRLKATTPKARFTLTRVAAGGKNPASALKRRRTCRFEGRDVNTPVYDGEKVLAGHVIAGPAIIEETTTTVVIPRKFVCSVDKYKNYVLTRRRG
jgi:N-methylhydantoinase A